MSLGSQAAGQAADARRTTSGEQEHCPCQAPAALTRGVGPDPNSFDQLKAQIDISFSVMLREGQSLSGSWLQLTACRQCFSE